MADDPNSLYDRYDGQRPGSIFTPAEIEAMYNQARAEGAEAQTLAKQSAAATPQTSITPTIRNRKSYRQAFRGILKGSRRRSPIVLILILLFGGGSIFTAILAPGASLLALSDILERDLNSQLSAWDNTSNQLWRTKLKQTTSGSCGAVKLACRWKSVNMDKFKDAVTLSNAASSGHLEVGFDEDAAWGPGRGKINKLIWTPDGGAPVDLSDPEKFADFMKKDIQFRKAILMVHNPKFHAFKNRTAMGFLSKMKASYHKVTGKTKEEYRKNMAQSVKGESSIDQKEPIKKKDKNGREYYEDPDSGRELSQEEVDRISKQSEAIKTSPGTSKLLTNMAKGAMITGAIDSMCTVYNMSRAVVTGAKTIRAAELVRYSMVYTTEAHAIKAEMSTPESVQVPSEIIGEIVPATKIADESALATTPAGQPLPQIDNPDAGKTGMNSPILAMSQSQDYPTNLNAETQSLLPGGGFTGTLAQINVAIANVLGADDPKTISERCQIVQNPFVRGGALVIGIAAGAGTFGASTAFSIAGSTLIGMALPYLTAQLADMAAGNVTAGLKGMGAVSAAAIGSGLMYNGFARSAGLMTMSPDKMASYQNRKRPVLASYDEIDKDDAKSHPFDATNKFSFLGSLARTAIPLTTQISSHNAFGALAALSTTSSVALSSSILPISQASDGDRSTLVRPNRYKLCTDPDYKALGSNVAVDPTCVMVFGLPNEAMEIDPETNLQWMVDNQEVVAGSDTGEALDNGRDWNYAKFLDQCVEQQPGVAEDPEANPTNGAGCTSDANFERNWHYAKFKLSLEVEQAMDQNLPGMTGGSQDNFGDGSTSTVGLDGWAYPTDKSKTQKSSGFGMRDGAMHNGIDLAGPLGTPLYAARDGKVIQAGPASGFGNWIILRHDVDGKRVDTVYGHMAASGVLVKLNQEVKAGEMIGRIGNEGFSTGPHLHFEIWDGGYSNIAGGTGKPIDPAPYLDKASTTPAGAGT